MTKSLIQCDFDGTITEEDVSFYILDKFATQPWRPWLEQYKEGKISVGLFNTTAFSFVKAGKETLLNYVVSVARVRPGLNELLNFAGKNNIEFVITSNGLDFYINFILDGLGIKGVKVLAAKSEFNPNGMKVKYVGPDGRELLDKFKETYTRLFIARGYTVIYIGNGVSDFPAAKLAHRVFATQDLAECCEKNNLKYTPFNELNDVVEHLKAQNHNMKIV